MHGITETRQQPLHNPISTRFLIVAVMLPLLVHEGSVYACVSTWSAWKFTLSVTALPSPTEHLL